MNNARTPGMLRSSVLLLVALELSACDASNASVAAPPQGSHTGANGASSAVQAQVAHEAKRVPLVGWQAATRYQFNLTLESEVNLSGKADQVRLRLVAPLALDAKGANDLERELLVTLDKVELQGSGGPGVDFSALEAELQEPFVITLSQGQVTAIRHKGGLSLFAVSIYRTVASALQLADRPQGSEQWTVEEHDATGRYEASYQLSPGGLGSGSVSRTKQRYLSSAAGQAQAASGKGMGSFGALAVPRVVNGQTTYSLDRATLKQVSHEEQLEMTTLQGAEPIVAKTKLSLVAGQSVPSNTDWDTTLSGLISLPANEMYTAPRVPSLDDVKIGDWTYDKALKALQDVAREQGEAKGGSGSEAKGAEEENAARLELSQRVAEPFRVMVAILRTQPAAAKRALVEVRREGPATESLLEALASAGAPGTQSTLTALANDKRLSDKVRQKAATSLLRADVPEPATIAALTEWFNGDALLFEHGAFGLGTFARKLRERGEIEESKRISVMLLERLQKEQATNTKVILLRAISNSAYLGAIDTLRPYLTSEDSSLRLASVQALRLMRSPAADELMAGRFKAEKMATVRVAILHDLPQRPASRVLLTAAQEASADKDNAQLRREAARILGQWNKTRATPAAAEVRSVLEAMAANDADEKVREEATRALKL